MFWSFSSFIRWNRWNQLPYIMIWSRCSPSVCIWMSGLWLQLWFLRSPWMLGEVIWCHSRALKNIVNHLLETRFVWLESLSRAPSSDTLPYITHQTFCNAISMLIRTRFPTCCLIIPPIIFAISHHYFPIKHSFSIHCHRSWLQ